METLGLSSTPQKSDNFFQRLFWPTIQNQYDVDLLGQQGFWVCVVIGVHFLVVTGQFVVGLLTALVFLAGACGVRQRSFLAASLIFTLYLINIVASFVIGTAGNPLIPLVCLMLLAANIRASVVSNKWMRTADMEADTGLPERMTETLGEKLSNQLPVAVWPRVKYVFYPLSVIMILLTVMGAFAIAHMTRRATVAHPTAVLQVSPSR
jgi:hypothetical protein